MQSALGDRLTVFIFSFCFIVTEVALLQKWHTGPPGAERSKGSCYYASVMMEVEKVVSFSANQSLASCLDVEKRAET